ncbi:hypothetical protein BJV74DRAFT_382502 [Russula compacta]|nr:hypothetical protein BJV74DRAFT_382502 [Russula compacta]
MVGRALSRSQAAAATATTKGAADGLDSVESANLAELPSSGASPSLSYAGERAFLTSRSGVVSDGVNVKSATGHHHHTRPCSWELEHRPAVAVSDLQANRERLVFYPQPDSSSQGGTHPALTRSQHPDFVAAHSQRILENIADPVFFSSPFRRGGASSPGGTSMDVQSAGDHASRGSSQTRQFHLNLVSESSVLPTYAELGQHPRRDLGPLAAAARTHASDLSLADLVAPQLGPSPALLPSIYWFLFDVDQDSVDWRRDVSRSPPSKTLSGDAGSMTAPHVAVTPTPVSFLAKWEDMLALERQIRSSHNANVPPQSRQARAQAQTQTQTQTQTVEAKRASCEVSPTISADHIPRCPDRSRCADEQGFSPSGSLSGIFGERSCEEDIPGSSELRSHAGVE